MRSILTFAAAALLAACAGPSQSAAGDANAPAGQPSAQPAAGAAAQVTVELTQGAASSSAGEENTAQAEGGSGVLTVRGTATTPTPCHRLSGAVERSGTQVTLRVSAAADPDAMCIQSIGAIGYTALIRGLPAGSYDLRVEHAYPGSGWQTAAALQARVTVR